MGIGMVMRITGMGMKTDIKWEHECKREQEYIR